MSSATTFGAQRATNNTSYWVLFAISFSHFVNDLMQALLPAVYPLLRDLYSLDFTQIGLITLVHQLTASFLQPVIGWYTDRNPKPYSLAVSMAFTMAGLLVLAYAGSFPMLLVAAALVGVGSSIFHPESSRVARMASGGRLGFAQSLFQVGGNIGHAIGPLMAAFIILQRGQSTLSWFALGPMLAVGVLWAVGRWYAGQNRTATPAAPPVRDASITRNGVVFAFVVIALLVLAKNVYIASMTSYYAFFMMERFGIEASEAQVYLFVFLGSVAAGTFIGGPIGDRIGRRRVIWVSMLGPLPFALAMPYMPLGVTILLTAIIGFVMASAFSQLVVYAQELMPGKVGMVAGMMFGVAFGMSAMGAAVLGVVADATSIIFVFQLCAFLPFLGFLTVFLPRAIR